MQTVVTWLASSPQYSIFEERTAHVERVVQLAGPVVVEYLRKDARMSVKEILVEYRVVVGERLGETRQTSGWDLLQRRLVSFVPDATHVDRDAVINVRHYFTDPAISTMS